MQKSNKKIRWLKASRQIRKRKRELRDSGRKKHFRFLKRLSEIENRKYSQSVLQRARLQKALYGRRHFSDPPLTVKIEQDFGIEDERGISYFLNKSASFIDSRSRTLNFDISLCNRMWPSGIVSLCSLEQWVELTKKKGKAPTIRSSPSDNMKVNSYLGHCGFYDYVGRMRDTQDNYYSDADIVKITRETKKTNIEERERQIMKLLHEFSGLGQEYLEWFDCVVLTEVFNNVTEHGISKYDRGWWLLAQHHKTHGVISLCVADNGIGIRNSLMTGPQRDDIEKKLSNTPANDGDFIQLALEETVSGAIEAPVKTGILMRSFPKGARRGNGLKRIRNTCRNLAIPFAILSHYGYLFVNPDGNISRIGSKPNRIFAGTMYHFTIRTMGEGIS